MSSAYEALRSETVSPQPFCLGLMFLSKARGSLDTDLQWLFHKGASLLEQVVLGVVMFMPLQQEGIIRDSLCD